MMHSTIRDDDAVLQINTKTRQIIVPMGCNVIGMVGDHSSEQLAFECPRFIEGHDVAGCAVKWISWVNARGDEGEDQITDVQVGTDSITFIWTVSAAVTAAAGQVGVMVNFMDLDSQGRVVYKWSAGDSKDLRVLPAMTQRVETGAALKYIDPEEESGLLRVDVDEGKLNSAVYNAVKAVLYG